MNKDLNNILKLAKIYPYTTEKRHKGFWLYGFEIRKRYKEIGLRWDQVKHFSKKKMPNDKRMKVTLYVFEQVNHRRKMLRAHNSNGEQGLIDYSNFVKKRQKEMVEEGFMNKDPKFKWAMKLVELVSNSKAGSLWAAVIAFFASFALIFGTKDEEE